MENKLNTWLNGKIQELGWGYSEIARRAGISTGTLSNVMAGRNNPGPDFCLGIAKAFDVPAEFVFRLAEILPPQPETSEKEEELLHAFRRLEPEDRDLAIASLRGMAGIKPPATGPAPGPAAHIDDGSDTSLPDIRVVLLELLNTLAKLATAEQLEHASDIAELLLQRQLESGDTRETLDGGKERSGRVDAGLPAVPGTERETDL